MIKQSLGGESEVWWEGFCSRVGIKAGDQWSKRPSRLPAHWEWTLLLKFHILLVARQENLTELITKLKKRLQSRSTANSCFPTMIYYFFLDAPWLEHANHLGLTPSKSPVNLLKSHKHKHMHTHMRCPLAAHYACLLHGDSGRWQKQRSNRFFFSFSLFFSFHFFFVEMSLTHSPLVT